MLINLGQTKIVVPEAGFHSGNRIKVNLEILIDEPTLTGYNGLVSASEYIGLSVSSEANKLNDT